MLSACAICGEPSMSTYCTEHRPARKTPKASRQARGYDEAWVRLSARARRLQPFCSVPGCTATDLTTDHTPEAWRRYAAGLPIRLQDVRVLCGEHNIAAGSARPGSERAAAAEVAAAPTTGVGARPGSSEPREPGNKPITLCTECNEVAGGGA